MAMPAHAPHQRWTRTEVRALIDDAPLATPRYELVDGDLLVTPAPRYRHQEVVARLMDALRPYLAVNPVGHALNSPFEVDLEDESLVQPDLFVLPSSEVRRLNAAEWRPADLAAVKQLVESGLLSLDGLITHREDAKRAPSAYGVAFDDPHCLKMVLDWRSCS